MGGREGCPREVSTRAKRWVPEQAHSRRLRGSGVTWGRGSDRIRSSPPRRCPRLRPPLPPFSRSGSGFPPPTRPAPQYSQVTDRTERPIGGTLGPLTSDASEEDSFQWMSRVLQVSPPGGPGRLASSPGWQQPLCKRFLRGPVVLPYFSLTNHDSGILGAISKIR